MEDLVNGKIVEKKFSKDLVSFSIRLFGRTFSGEGSAPIKKEFAPVWCREMILLKKE